VRERPQIDGDAGAITHCLPKQHLQRGRISRPSLARCSRFPPVVPVKFESKSSCDAGTGGRILEPVTNDYGSA